MSGCTALLLSVLILFWPAVGQTKFTMTAEQDVYEAEENTNITMTWLLHFNTSRPPEFLQIDLMNVKTKTRIFFYNSEADTEKYPDESYRGRLQCDPQLTRKGRLECLLNDLRLNDTSTYQCIVVLNNESSYKPCDLNVTAAIKSPVEETSKPASRGRIGFYASLGLFAAVIVALFAVTSYRMYFVNNETHSNIQITSSVLM